MDQYRSVSDRTKATVDVWKIGMRPRLVAKNLGSKRNFTPKNDMVHLLAA
jgi:hypothetical protein